ncbi:MAG: L,D-transpeptidase [Methylobacterium sp.]|nr:L,D-transpeptidase [Methylobacterium sp.]MCA3598273.1 L,D-transpeptidase [Methylobacterium sp.]MCA3600026.1 L,D-transpeptidase [Methylobacterium sp.]MCA3602525.1 L,D-transpeptidase [Methylobacterium sp.]MCA3605103.1 L,D-transpeptidase [Methylobacterium sp.]
MSSLSRVLKTCVAACILLAAAACNTYTSFPDPSLSKRDVELLALAPQGFARELDPARARIRMPNSTGEKTPGTIIVDNEARFLYFVEDPNTVLRYEISPGMESHQWRGTATIGRKVEWPSWTPGTEARRMAPGLPAMVPGGPNNPLGARGLYLHDERGRDTEYRIHGTNEPEMIGQPVSLGCIRMHNIDVIDLYTRVQIGSKVIVR